MAAMKKAMKAAKVVEEEIPAPMKKAKKAMKASKTRATTAFVHSMVALAAAQCDLLRATIEHATGA